MRMSRSRVTLARMDAAEIDRQVTSPLTMRLVQPSPTKSQLPSTSTWSGVTPRPSMARRAASRWASAMPSSSHSTWLAPPTAQATHHSANRSKRRFPLRLGQHLRVSDLVHPPVAGQHGGTDHQRARPRPTAHLVDTDDELVALRPQRPFDVQGRHLAGGHDRLGLLGRPGRTGGGRPLAGCADRASVPSADDSDPGQDRRATPGPPAVTSPMATKPARAKAAASAPSTAASKPPEVCGS